MADCGIKEYDELPARIGWIDVDYLRWRLYRCDHPPFYSEWPIIHWVLSPDHDAEARKIIVAKLDKALAKERGTA